MSWATDEMKYSIREEKAASIAKNFLQLHILTYEQIAKANRPFSFAFRPFCSANTADRVRHMQGLRGRKRKASK